MSSSIELILLSSSISFVISIDHDSSDGAYMVRSTFSVIVSVNSDLYARDATAAAYETVIHFFSGRDRA
jgi:hypothetical protein